MVTIKTVAIAGATGNLGPQVLNALVESGKFEITVLRRIGSESTVPHAVKILDVDYESLESLTSALQGQDVVVSTLGNMAPESQKRLVDAAVAAGAKRFLPGEFGSVMNAATSQLPIFAGKLAAEKQLEAYAAEGKITYTYVFNGAFLDWGVKANFLVNLAQNEPEIYDGGDNLFSTTTTVTVGKAVVGVLTHYEETKNRAVFIQDAVMSQNKLLAIIKKLTPGKTWKPVPVDTEELKVQADTNIAKGIFDIPTLYSYLYIANFGKDKVYGAHFQKLDNELLGIKEMTDEEVEAVVKDNLPKD